MANNYSGDPKYFEKLEQEAAAKHIPLHELVKKKYTEQGPNYKNFEHKDGKKPDQKLHKELHKGRKKLDTVLYRGSRKSYNFREGQTIMLGDKSYSKDRAVAESFLYGKSGGTIFTLNGKKEAVDIEEYSDFQNEKECILKGGTEGVVTKIISYPNSGRKEYEVCIIETEFYSEMCSESAYSN